MKLYAVNADYRYWNKGHNWYYVEAQSKQEARKKFAETITWLDIYEVQEVDAESVNKILSNPYKYIVLH